MGATGQTDKYIQFHNAYRIPVELLNFSFGHYDFARLGGHLDLELSYFLLENKYLKMKESGEAIGGPLPAPSC